MSDRVFEIEFRSTYTGAGAERLREDLGDLNQQVEEITAPTGSEPTPLDPLIKSAEEASQKIPVAERELQRFLAANGVAAGEAGKLATELARGTTNLGGFKDALEGVLGPASTGEVNINALKKSVFALGSESAAVSSLGLAGLVVGLGLLVKGAYDSSEPIANLILSLQGLNESAVDASGALAKVEKNNLKLDGQLQALDAMTQRLQEDRREADNLVAALNRVEQSRLKAETARINREESEGVAAAGGDKAQESIVRARAEAQRAALTGQTETAEAERGVTSAKDEISRLAYEQVALEKRLQQAISEREKFEVIIRQKAEELALSYEEALRLSQDSNKLRAEIDRAQKSGNQGEAADLDVLGQAGKSFGKADRTATTAERGLNENRQASAIADLGLQAAVNDLKAAQEKNTQTAVEVGKQYGEASRDLAGKVAELTAQLAADKERLAVAQGSTGTPGSAQDQTAAYQKVQETEQALQRMKQLQDDAAREIQAGSARFGESFTSSASSVKANADAAKTAVESAGQAVSAAATVSTNALEATATRVVASVDGNLGKIPVAMDKLGGSLTGAIDRVAGGVERIAGAVDTRLAVLERQLAAVDTIARSAIRQAEIATSQIAASR
jgi:hypothetical protein